MWTKFGLKLQKNFEMRTPGEGEGVVSDFGHPRMRGRGVEKGKNFADVLYGWPLIISSAKFFRSVLGQSLVLGLCKNYRNQCEC